MPRIMHEGIRKNVTTTISLEAWELARKLGINWNEALERGVRFFAKDRALGLEEGTTYEKDDKINKLIQTNKALQNHILRLSDELESKR